MALTDLLNLNQSKKKIGLSEERVTAILPTARKYIAFWREYPDLLVDYMVKGNNEEAPPGSFHFYFYQRCFLRAVMRYQYVYAVFPRAYENAPIRKFLFPWTNFFNLGNSIFIIY